MYTKVTKYTYLNVVLQYDSDGLSNGVQGHTTLPRSWTPTREERLIKFSGIGPVDETGMPIASRSVRTKIHNVLFGYQICVLILLLFFCLHSQQTESRKTVHLC